MGPPIFGFPHFWAPPTFVLRVSDQKPDVMYADIGGMDIQKQEVREAVELPLTHFELYKQVGAWGGFGGVMGWVWGRWGGLWGL